jgi:uncharacterized coiled-coil DUF342 family protein
MLFLLFINGSKEFYSELFILFTQKIEEMKNNSNVHRYHTILLKKVKPLHKKCKEIEQDVLEQDQKLILLDNKSQVSFCFC